MTRREYTLIRLRAPDGMEIALGTFTSKAKARKAYNAARRQKPSLLHKIVVGDVLV